MANAENEPALTAADVREEFPDWQLQQGHSCWSATRRPTPTAQESVIGRDLDQLAVKLREETGGQG
jgi:hypothetical protein